MSNIRDEFGKILDIRIPPNGYRRYIKEVGRTGGFQDTQRDDCIIVMAQAIEDMQQQIAELKSHPNINPFDKEPQTQPASTMFDHLEPLKSEALKPELKCEKCGLVLDSKIALMGHSRKKDHQDATITQQTGRNSD